MVKRVAVPLETLDELAFIRWGATALVRLEAAVEELNALNVFPVPDGDTGSNLFLTLSSALKVGGTKNSFGNLGMILENAAREALMSARGNSGVILSQLMVGLAEEIAQISLTEGRGCVQPSQLAQALCTAANKAREGVPHPVQGTILSVADAASAAAMRAASAGKELVEVVDAAVLAAEDALANTTEQLEVLARAAVVDAGGAGLLVLLRALSEVVHQRESAEKNVSKEQRTALLEAACPALSMDRLEYEVVYRLHQVCAMKVHALAQVLEQLGQSVVVAGTSEVDGVQELVTVHVHTVDPGAIIEAAYQVGLPRDVQVEALPAAGDQVEPVDIPAGSEHTKSSGLALIAVGAGQGAAEELSRWGVMTVEPIPAWADSSVAFSQLKKAVIRADGDVVLLMVTDARWWEVVEKFGQEAQELRSQVVVVRCESVVAVLSAVSLFDAAADPVEEATRLARGVRDIAVGSVRWSCWGFAEVGCEMSRGDFFGVVGAEVVSVGDAVSVARMVVARLLMGVQSQGCDPETVAVLVGAGQEQLAEEVIGWVGEQFSEVEVSVLRVCGVEPVLEFGVE
ncbi:DAK2 domain-containing protein [Dermatophilus congolensis]|uniref:DAK2 domain-containing protein n=1 Tax=Dermatophilus congolensis TaxID=1863 RepID=UPI001AAE85E0|nr:DAK2 domain-containing protein [Dermatophilus congolensis]MBO3151219.1 DAK2 domain-containing protein [Dermatophilus congolensis]MBO3161779.1 DAK2 domain-containing protein [Dermatophilus congolensis]MBO3162503.1 DAK2 domain-containing protein [Dermatophilus congolensis]MBO3176058.1 DAK2 domain-containing protein [Dermatophilus congolensis]